ncbi:MAG: DUF362 domain-containing protein [Candidatus Bathyarchaeia archaeon]
MSYQIAREDVEEPEVVAYSAYIAKVDGELKRNLLEGLEFINWKDYVKKDSVVFVKPNFTFPRYKKGVTTSPELLKCLLEILKDRTSSVIVGESDGGNHSFKAEDAFRGHQMYEICREIGVELVNLSKLHSKFVESKIQSRKVKVQLPKMLLEKVDCFISAPVLKVHVMTGVSLGLKNLWGCYPDTMRCLYHQNLDCKLALMAKLLNPRITVIDGIYALNSHGPMYGNPLKMNLILSSNNIVVADALGAAIMGIPLKRAKHIIVAEKEGIGTTNLEKVRVNTDWKQYRRQFQIRKTLLDRASVLLFHSEIIAKFVMASPFTPLVYRIAGMLRTSEEKAIASQLNTSRHYM